MAIEGLLGKSTREEYWRLYFSSEVNDYIEFKEGDVLASESIPKEQSRLGLESTKVWLNRNAMVSTSWE